jgi:hypothetical protein
MLERPDYDSPMLGLCGRRGGRQSPGFTAAVCALLTCAVPYSSAQEFVRVVPLYFTMAQQGLNPKPQSFTLTSSGPRIGWKVEARTTTGGDWLQVKALTGCSPAEGCFTPSVNTVTVNAIALHAGDYSGAIVYTSGAAAAMIVPVSLTVEPLGGLMEVGRRTAILQGGIDEAARRRADSGDTVLSPRLALVLISLAAAGALFALVIRWVYRRNLQGPPSILAQDTPPS